MLNASGVSLGKDWCAPHSVDTLPASVRCGLALACALLTGISAQVSVPLPFTPVPLTGQVFAVLFSGILLGAGFGSLSQILYLAGGCAGISWFSPVEGCVIRGTFGYLVGFIPAAALAGSASRKTARPHVLLAACAGSIAVIHLCGVAWLAPWLGIGPAQAWAIGSLPFFPFDILKACLVIAVVCAIRGRCRQ